jgi:Zn-dependent protease/CBS domain-containing protein
MFGKRVTLFTLLGFAVRADISWLIIAVLVTWSLAEGFFPRYYQGLSRGMYWGMGAAGMLGLFTSIVVHELAHSLVARRYGLPIKGITLFIFGGVAEMDEEPPSARAEWLMAIAGPIVSLLLALGCSGLATVGKSSAWPEPVTGVLGYLGFINRIVAIFNLIPAFPLDGGRVLRAALWAWKGSLHRATRIASRLGKGCSLLLILYGVLTMLRGNVFGGMWMFLIGTFLGHAATMSYQQLLARQALEGEPVHRFMEPNPVTVPPTLTVEELVEGYIYTYHFKMFPVVDRGRLVGCVSTREVQQLPRQAWKQRTVADLLQPCSPTNTIGPHEDALKALATMNQTQTSRLMVVDAGRLVGVITLKDLLEFLALKVELEERGR